LVREELDREGNDNRDRGEEIAYEKRIAGS